MLTGNQAGGTIEPLEIFRVGSHTAMSGEVLDVTVDILRAAADSYDPARHEAPLVIGHPKIDAPAMGWVKSLSYKNGGLFATVDQLEPEFAELVRQGRFKKISGSFWMPGAPGNPVPDALTLKHVGFLGAAVPAVKGMKPVKFAGGADGALTFGDPVSFSMQEEYEGALRRVDNERFAEAMIAEGRLLPLHKEGLLAFMAKLDDASVIEFADANGQQTSGHREWFKSFVGSGPKVVSFGQINVGNLPSRTAVGLTMPDGYAVFAAGLDLHARATAYAKANNISFADAVDAVHRGEGA